MEPGCVSLCRLAAPLPGRSRGSLRRQLALPRLRGEWDRKLSSSGTCCPPRRCLTEAFKNGPRWRGRDGASLSPFPCPGRAEAAARRERPLAAGHGTTPARTKAAPPVWPQRGGTMAATPPGTPPGAATSTGTSRISLCGEKRLVRAVAVERPTLH